MTAISPQLPQLERMDSFTITSPTTRGVVIESPYDERSTPIALHAGGELLRRLRSPSPVAYGGLTTFWQKQKGVILVVIAMVFSSLMGTTARLLETASQDGRSMDPFQIIFFRQSITVALSLLYMWSVDIPKWPLGPKHVRKLLFSRAFGGFFGVFGFYYSLQYLSLAEATVLGFLAPSVASYACFILLKEPFTRVQQIGGIVSFLGVLAITRPVSLLSMWSVVSSGSGFSATSPSTAPEPLPPEAGFTHLAVTPSQRASAVGFGMIGVLGSAWAFTSIRWVGKQAHPLISVTYFSAWSGLVSGLCLLVLPGFSFRVHASTYEWFLLLSIGVCGFTMQLLLTAGLSHEKSSRPSNMLYTQMLFALAMDRIMFDVTPGIWSILGSSLILGSALVVAMKKDDAARVSRSLSVAEEEMGMLHRQGRSRSRSCSDLNDPEGRR